MKLIFKRLQSYFPTKLPVGKSSYYAWLDDIIELTGPIADKDSLQWVISNEVMRLSPGRDSISLNSMVKLIRKYAANQVAASVVMDLKAKQEEAQKAQQAAQLAAANQAETAPETTPESGKASN